MEVFLTRDARNRMRQQGVSEEAVRLVVDQPELVTESIKGRSNAWGRYAGRWMRATFRDENDRRIVITVALTRRRPAHDR